jgi:hypothetical protein
VSRLTTKFLLLAMSLLLFTGSFRAFAISSGSILVIDSTAGTNAQGALFAVNPSNGQRTLVSDFGASSQGPLGVDPESVSWVPALVLGLQPTILVADGSAGTNGFGALFQVDPNTGQRTLVSDFGNTAQGALGLYPVSIAVAPAGLLGLGSSILVLDAYAGTNGQGALFTINPQNGLRTLLSDFGLTSQGPQGAYPDSVALLSPGLLGLGTTLVVSDGSAGTTGLGAVFAINPATGNRSLLSDFGDTSQGSVDPDLNSFPSSVILYRSGLLGLSQTLLVTDTSAGTNEDGAVITVDPITGNRSILSDFGNSSQGTLGADPNSIAISGTTILVLDGEAGTNGLGALFTINPQGGQRTVLSDFGKSTQGPLGGYPTGLAVVP